VGYRHFLLGAYPPPGLAKKILIDFHERPSLDGYKHGHHWLDLYSLGDDGSCFIEFTTCTPQFGCSRGYRSRMIVLTRILGWLYAQSLKLYPKGFRAIFGAEMDDVFAQAIREGNAIIFCLQELKGLPGSLIRQHWYAWTHKETVMLTNYKRPEWFFYPGWIGVSILAFPLAWFAYFLTIGLVTRWVGDTIYVNGTRHITEDYLFLYIFFPTLCLISGILQYGLLQRYVPKMGAWVLATMAGCLLAFATIILIYRVFEAAFYFWNGTFVFATIGGMIGLCQWLFLRRRIPKAGWWVLASFLGWGLAVLGSFTEVRNGSALAQLITFSLSPPIFTSIAWWFLLKPGAGQENYQGG